MTLAAADFSQAAHLIDADDCGEAIPYLVRILSTNPTSDAIEPCLVNRLRLLFLTMDKMNEKLKLGKETALQNLAEQYDHFFTEEPE